MGYNNNFYGWSFNDVNGKAVNLRPDIDGVTEEELSDALKKIQMSGDGLTYTLSVDGREAGTINIPKDAFLQDVQYENGNIIFIIGNEDGETTSVSVPATEFVSEEAITTAVNTAIASAVEDFYTKTEVDDKISESVNALVGGAPETLDTLKELADVVTEVKDVLSDVNEELATKANASDVYTKEDADETFIKEHQSLEGYATETYVDGKVAGLASADVVDELNVSMIERNREVDTALLAKADKSDVYSKIQVNETFAAKTDLDEYIKSDAVDNKVAAAIAQVVANAPEDFDTLKEVADYIASDKTKAAVIEDTIARNSAAIADKADTADVYTKTEADGKFLTEHQDISGLSTKEEVATAYERLLKNILTRIWNNTDEEIKGYFKTKFDAENGSYAQMWNESDGGGSQFYNKLANILSYVGVNDGDANGICVQIYSKDKTTNVGSRLNVNPNGIFYKVSGSASLNAEDELAVKGDISALIDEIAAMKSRITELEARPVPVVSTEQLFSAIGEMNEGDALSAVLTSDMSLTDGTPLEIKPGTTVNLNLAGHTLSNPVSADGAVVINEGGNLTIENGTVVNGSTDAQGSDAIRNNGGNLTINGGTFGSSTNRGAAVRNNGGLVTINGGTFETVDRGLNQGWAYVFIANADDAEIVINNAHVDCDPNGMFAANAGVINVNGGDYRMGTTGKPTYYMAYVENGTVNLNGGTFKWTKGAGAAPTYIDGTGSVNIAEGVEIEIVEETVQNGDGPVDDNL